MEPGATRYVSDVPYAADYSADLAPAWLDFVALLSGFAPPDRTDGFAWSELGCGQGLSAIVVAAAHPDGILHAVDAMPEHIRTARRTAEAAGVGNLRLHALDFAAACELALPRFQYIVAHGVYSWVDEAAKAALRRFVDRHLAPGGLFYVSYNAMPGWAVDTPFQHLVRALAASEPGDSNARFAAAVGALRRFEEAGAPALRASPLATAGYDRQKDRVPRGYFAHEYLAPAWRPLYVDEVRADLAEIGLEPAGSAILRNNFDSYVLRAAAREALRAIESRELRELVRDYFLFTRFRSDVFARGPALLEDEERRRRLFACSFALARPAGLVEYSMRTQAGRVGFDNPVSRSLVAALAAGPRRLSEIPCQPDGAQDLLGNALALAAAGTIRPVGAGAADVERVNAALLELLQAAASPGLHVLPSGTALWVDRRVLQALHDGDAAPAERAAWVEFLRRSGS